MTTFPNPVGFTEIPVEYARKPIWNRPSKFGASNPLLSDKLSDLNIPKGSDKVKEMLAINESIHL